MENKKLFQYIAGGCFALVAVINIITFLSGYAQTITYISQIGFILIAVGIFINKPVLSTVGGGILTIYQLINIIQVVSIARDSWYYVPSPLNYAFMVALLIAYILITIAPIINKGIVSIFSGVVRIIALIIQVILNGGISGKSIILALLFAVGAILIGIAPSNQQIDKQNSSQNITKKSNMSSSIDQITKLKELLDKGIISQSEFDEKKKQLLK